MTDEFDLPTDPEMIVDEHREMLVRVLRHSSDPYARACAWTLLDAGSDAPTLEQVESEIQAFKEAG